MTPATARVSVTYPSSQLKMPRPYMTPRMALTSVRAEILALSVLTSPASDRPVTVTRAAVVAVALEVVAEVAAEVAVDAVVSAAAVVVVASGVVAVVDEVALVLEVARRSKARRPLFKVA